MPDKFHLIPEPTENVGSEIIEAPPCLNERSFSIMCALIVIVGGSCIKLIEV